MEEEGEIATGRKQEGGGEKGMAALLSWEELSSSALKF